MIMTVLDLSPSFGRTKSDITFRNPEPLTQSQHARPESFVVVSLLSNVAFVTLFITKSMREVGRP